ncbi:hypothetical protein DFS34DRAFT_611120 [Phlyctochytrium arcticum]|nr:hypothetical protein DFS34DRAFT_611120 [Phlyctochytrium arcticum]
MSSALSRWPMLAALVFLASVNGADALCRCSCPRFGNQLISSSSCNVGICESRFGNCPTGWRTYNALGAMVGGIIGGIAFLFFLCCVCIFCCRHRRNKGMTTVYAPGATGPGMFGHRFFNRRQPQPSPYTSTTSMGNSATGLNPNGYNNTSTNSMYGAPGTNYAAPNMAPVQPTTYSAPPYPPPPAASGQHY